MKKKFLLAIIILNMALASYSVASNYVVDEGDVLTIKVYEHEDLNTIVRVSGEGNISLPLIGEVNVINLTLHQIAQKITMLLADGYVVTPQVTVDINKFRIKKVTLLGKVNSPGLYELHKKTTFLELISKAQGLTGDAGNKAIIKRKAFGDEKEKTIIIDLKRLIESGDTSQNILIKNGDNIFIPTTAFYYITGEIKQPNKYNYTEKITVFQAITQAGGFTEKVSLSRIKITREIKARKQVLTDVSLDEDVLPNDIINVQSVVLAKNEEKVTLLGKIRNPGIYVLEEKTTFLEIISQAGGLRDDSGAKAIIKRKSGSGGKEKILTINLKHLIEEGNTSQNILIKEGDYIYIASIETFFITGEVKNPAKYKHAEGLTVMQAITQAGGFTDKAAPGNVKITRNKMNDKQKTQILTDISLDENVLPNDIIDVQSAASAKSEEKVTLLGKIRNPGIYVLERETTFLEIISQAGGLRDDSGAKAIIKRKSGSSGKEKILTINLKHLIEEGNTSQNILIKEGDYIYIAATETFFITGEVKNPAKYKHTEGLTVIQAITHAGGFTGKAAPANVKIIRKINDKKKVFEKVAMDASVLPNDVIVVPESFF
ncbi:SLBB domain-containing protein [Desulfococcaceae bacterium HSG7]|nr:SLBB domain-containing protein [Desulfococcaceae bacterium HSG7]